jgi:hypothetical protein
MAFLSGVHCSYRCHHTFHLNTKGTSTYSSIAADSTGELATRASILTSQDGSLYDEVTLGGGPNGPGEYDDEDLYMPPTDMGGGGGGGGDDDGDTDSIDLIDANVYGARFLAGICPLGCLSGVCTLLPVGAVCSIQTH